MQNFTPSCKSDCNNPPILPIVLLKIMTKPGQFWKQIEYFSFSKNVLFYLRILHSYALIFNAFYPSFQFWKLLAFTNILMRLQQIYMYFWSILVKENVHFEQFLLLSQYFQQWTLFNYYTFTFRDLPYDGKDALKVIFCRFVICETCLNQHI